uniref:Uncharacterized protein n=1 Tax=Rhabditophanes sp. KR3021 TaxID=114890 RepID=A0AC35U8Z8_9BILA
MFKTRQSIRLRYKDISRVIYFNDQGTPEQQASSDYLGNDSIVDNSSINSGSITSLDSITTQLTHQRFGNVPLTIVKTTKLEPKRPSLLRRLSNAFSKSSTSLNRSSSMETSLNHNQSSRSAPNEHDRISVIQESTEQRHSDTADYSIPWEAKPKVVSPVPRSNSNSSEDDEVILVTRL